MKTQTGSISLESVERLHGEELARISHALKTPLTSIIGFTSAILNDPSMERETCAEFMTIVKSEGERLSRFVDELLYVSFSDTYVSNARKELTDIRELMQTSFRVAAAKLNQSPSRFELEIDSGIKPVLIDREFTLGMISTIIGSAARFSPHYLPVKVSVTGLPEALGLRVESRRRGGGMDVRLKGGNIADADAAGLSRTRYLLELRGGTLSAHHLETGNTAVLATFPVLEAGK